MKRWLSIAALLLTACPGTRYFGQSGAIWFDDVSRIGTLCHQTKHGISISHDRGVCPPQNVVEKLVDDFIARIGGRDDVFDLVGITFVPQAIICAEPFAQINPDDPRNWRRGCSSGMFTAVVWQNGGMYDWGGTLGHELGHMTLKRYGLDLKAPSKLDPTWDHGEMVPAEWRVLDDVFRAVGSTDYMLAGTRWHEAFQLAARF